MQVARGASLTPMMHACCRQLLACWCGVSISSGTHLKWLAKQMSRQGHSCCSRLVPLLALRRPPWLLLLPLGRSPFAAAAGLAAAPTRCRSCLHTAHGREPVMDQLWPLMHSMSRCLSAWVKAGGLAGASMHVAMQAAADNILQTAQTRNLGKQVLLAPQAAQPT